MKLDLIGAQKAIGGPARETIFQREDDTWGWYDEGWQDGDGIHHPERSSAVSAQSKYATELMNELENYPEKF